MESSTLTWNGGGRALVTGGSRGIGRAIVESLHRKGYDVFTTGRRESGADIDELAAAGIHYRAADVSATETHEELLTWARPDLLVNNAGMAPRVRADLLEMSENSLREVLDVNLIGPLLLTQLAARGMVERGRGMIVNISSVSADTVSVNRGEYCLSKAGVSMMTQLFAARLAEYGILVYEIRPGVIATDMTAGVKERYDGLFEGGLAPIARWGQPEDVARAVMALADGALSYSTGEVLRVDGGMHIRRL